MVGGQGIETANKKGAGREWLDNRPCAARSCATPAPAARGLAAHTAELKSPKAAGGCAGQVCPAEGAPLPQRCRCPAGCPRRLNSRAAYGLKSGREIAMQNDDRRPGANARITPSKAQDASVAQDASIAHAPLKQAGCICLVQPRKKEACTATAGLQQANDCCCTKRLRQSARSQRPLAAADKDAHKRWHGLWGVAAHVACQPHTGTHAHAQLAHSA